MSQAALTRFCVRCALERDADGGVLCVRCGRFFCQDHSDSDEWTQQICGDCWDKPWSDEPPA